MNQLMVLVVVIVRQEKQRLNSRKPTRRKVVRRDTCERLNHRARLDSLAVPRRASHESEPLHRVRQGLTNHR